MSGSIPALGARDLEQQKFVRELYQGIQSKDAAHDERHMFTWELTKVLLTIVVSLLRGEGVLHEMDLEEDEALPEAQEAKEYFFSTIMDPLSKFCRTELEARVILWMLLKKLLTASVEVEVMGSWMNEVMRDPKTALGSTAGWR